MQILTVTECNKYIKEVLNEDVLKVQGEVSNFKISQGRFVFFDLKDGGSYVNCFLMAFNLKQEIKEGQEIIVTGSPSLFTKSGKFHIAVRNIELVGKGALQQEFERLKQKLESEGLFSQERKRNLPRFPEKIGIITSEDAAAYTDIMRILKQRFPVAQVVLKPVRVQGDGAPQDIVKALAYFKKNPIIDVLIISRGGGSMEDLQAFNNEAVVRSVFALNIPTISGVGHERDTTLIDYVADVRAATPTHAAEIVVPHQDDIIYQIEQNILSQKRAIESILQEYEVQVHRSMQIMSGSMQDQLSSVKNIISRFHLATRAFQSRVNEMTSDLKYSKKAMEKSILQKIQEQMTVLGLQRRVLKSVNPKNVLERGYSITYTNNNKIIRKSEDVKKGEVLITQLHKGKIISEVK